MKIGVSLWQFVPPQEDEEPGMPTYRIAGLANKGHILADAEGDSGYYKLRLG